MDGWHWSWLIQDSVGSKLDGNTCSTAWGSKERALVGSPRHSIQSRELAMKMCAEKMFYEGSEGTRISICSDSMSALNAMDSVLVYSNLVRKRKTNLNTLSICSGDKITLY